MPFFSCANSSTKRRVTELEHRQKKLEVGQKKLEEGQKAILESLSALCNQVGPVSPAPSVHTPTTRSIYMTPPPTPPQPIASPTHVMVEATNMLLRAQGHAGAPVMHNYPPCPGVNFQYC
eukprot:TRINITY_DN66791_c7_g3_i2.p1 TRINITY_DN66791_c7_g3~~TRINITY_DN66791_c7_g3_i2.p1  ORF type:complete len:120 (-),score=5.85 TRINITY_DN66791_c7_g3_i2:172-531(-)